jgi:4-amino-4-deoxy-L-arabinose transferase-like glycosyltransferase
VTIPDVPDSARNRRVLLMLALIGLGLAHHRTVVLLLPGLFVYLLWTAPALLRPQRAWLAWLAALLAPLLLYAYLPLRAAQGVADLNGSYVNTWAGFWDHVLARRYTTFFAANALSRSYTAADWWQLWLAQTGWLGAGLSVLGLGHARRTQRAPRLGADLADADRQSALRRELSSWATRKSSCCRRGCVRRRWRAAVSP